MAAAEKNLFAEERRQRILATLASGSHIRVNDLAARFDVSTATLRNDLRALEAAGLLRRTHGGAVAMEHQVAEQPADTAVSENQAAKIAIGRAAAALVHDGETIFVDSGSTTIEVVRALTARRGLTVITNDCIIASEAERTLPDITVILLGGVVRTGFHYTIGPATVGMLRELSAPVAFLAASAFSFDRGFTVHTLELANFKRTLIARSERQVALVDSSKFGLYTTATYAELPDITDLVTDAGIDPSDRRRIQQAADGPALIVA